MRYTASQAGESQRQGRILKAKESNDSSCKRLTANFSSETMETGRQQYDIFKLTEKSVNQEFYIQKNYTFKSGGEIKQKQKQNKR